MPLFTEIRELGLLLTASNRARGPYWRILARGRGSTDRAQQESEGQYSPVRLEPTRLVSCLLYGTRFLIVKYTSGGLHLKGFHRDVFLMTQATPTKASYHEFENQIYWNQRKIV